jgi:hypothetical protein
MKAGQPVLKFCSPQCRPEECVREKKQPGVEYGRWVRVSHFEPDPAGGVTERWRILREVGAPDAHRKVPMPEWPGPGSCRWCLEPTIYETGKKKGEPAKRNWHNACYYEYRLHTEIAAQFDFLFSRDGPRCQICGAGGYASAGEIRIRPEGMSWAEFYDADKQQLPLKTILKPAIVLEVDHVIPLWRAWSFGGDLEARRRWYGPANLWLICIECHKAKTAIEAAERAAVKRSS